MQKYCQFFLDISSKMENSNINPAKGGFAGYLGSTLDNPVGNSENNTIKKPKMNINQRKKGRMNTIRNVQSKKRKACHTRKMNCVLMTSFFKINQEAFTTPPHVIRIILQNHIDSLCIMLLFCAIQ